MKILKDGNLKKIHPDIKIECPRCGCIFITENGEYKRYENYQGDWYETMCPYCKRKIAIDCDKAEIVKE